MIRRKNTFIGIVLILLSFSMSLTPFRGTSSLFEDNNHLFFVLFVYWTGISGVLHIFSKSVVTSLLTTTPLLLYIMLTVYFSFENGINLNILIIYSVCYLLVIFFVIEEGYNV